MKTILAFVVLFSFVIGLAMIAYREDRTPRNIEHDGHLFIQCNNSLIHHPACSCQSSLRAIRASK